MDGADATPGAQRQREIMQAGRAELRRRRLARAVRRPPWGPAGPRYRRAFSYRPSLYAALAVVLPVLTLVALGDSPSPRLIVRTALRLVRLQHGW
jgi:hypothetical protein